MRNQSERKQLNRRTGFTLLELLIVLSVSSFLLVIAGAWINKTVQFTAKTNRIQRQHVALQRLASDLRNDIRSAIGMRLENDSLILNHADDRVATYTISGSTLRVNKQYNAKTIYQNHFRLGQGAQLVWDDAELPEFISFYVRQSAPEIVGKSSSKKFYQGGPVFCLRSGPCAITDIKIEK